MSSHDDVMITALALLFENKALISDEEAQLLAPLIAKAIITERERCAKILLEYAADSGGDDQARLAATERMMRTRRL